MVEMKLQHNCAVSDNWSLPSQRFCLCVCVWHLNMNHSYDALTEWYTSANWLKLTVRHRYDRSSEFGTFFLGSLHLHKKPSWRHEKFDQHFHIRRQLFGEFGAILQIEASQLCHNALSDLSVNNQRIHIQMSSQTKIWNLWIDEFWTVFRFYVPISASMGIFCFIHIQYANCAFIYRNVVR